MKQLLIMAIFLSGKINWCISDCELIQTFDKSGPEVVFAKLISDTELWIKPGSAFISLNFTLNFIHKDPKDKGSKVCFHLSPSNFTSLNEWHRFQVRTRCAAYYGVCQTVSVMDNSISVYSKVVPKTSKWSIDFDYELTVIEVSVSGGTEISVDCWDKSSKLSFKPPETPLKVTDSVLKTDASTEENSYVIAASTTEASILNKIASRIFL